MDRGRGPGPGPGPSRELDRSRASSVSDALADSASAQAAPKPSPCKGRATQGRAQPLPSGVPPDVARVVQEARSCGVRPRLSLRARSRRATQGGEQPGRPGGARVEPGANSDPGRRRLPLALEGAASRRVRCQARAAKQRRGGRSHPQRPPPGEVRAGPESHAFGVRPGAGPLPRSEARPLPSRRRRRCQARPEPSDAGEGAAPLPSTSSGGSPGRAGSPHGWGLVQVQPARLKARQAARASWGGSHLGHYPLQHIPTYPDI